MLNNQNKDTEKINVEISVPEIELVKLDLAEDLFQQIPKDRRNNLQDLTDYLSDAIRIGILATVNASITIDTAKLDKIVSKGVDDYKNQIGEAQSELENLLDGNLTGENSLFMINLRQMIGEGGELEQLLNNLNDSLSDPENIKSVPYKTSLALQDTVTGVQENLELALDITDENTALGKFVRSQRGVFSDLEESISERLTRIETALNVDEILQKQEAEKEELYQKSTQKGHHFENDTVDSLQDIAGLFGDRIEHTGGEGVGKSRSKIGDIVIVINSPAIPEIRVSIEAKSGNSISRKELVRQTRDGVKMRGAVCGIGLMERKHMGIRQQVVEQEAENYIVGVDWDNQDFLALEVVYRTLRAQLIAEEIRSSGNNEINIEKLKKHLTQAKTDLGLFQSMKGGAKSAITTLEELRKTLDVVEDKVRKQLSEAENLLE